MIRLSLASRLPCPVSFLLSYSSPSTAIPVLAADPQIMIDQGHQSCRARCRRGRLKVELIIKTSSRVNAEFEKQGVEPEKVIQAGARSVSLSAAQTRHLRIFDDFHRATHAPGGEVKAPFQCWRPRLSFFARCWKQR